MRNSLASLCVPFLATPLAAATLTVGPSGSGAMFTEIHAAIDAAADGDTILVQPGTYAGFSLYKPLSVLGQGAGVTIANPPFIVVGGIPAAGEVVLAGLDADLGGVNVTACAGRVLLQELVVPQVLVQQSSFVLTESCTFEYGGLRAEQSAVWISNSRLRGLAGKSSTFCGQGGPGMPGLALEGSVAYVARCVVNGGVGGKVACIPNQSFQGGSGVRANASVVKLVGGGATQIRGGDSLPGSSVQAGGGHGLELAGGSEALVANAVAVFGGNSGVFGPPAQAIVVQAGSELYAMTTTYPTQVLVPSSAQLGAAFALTIEGNPSSLVRVYVAASSTAPFVIDGIDGGVLLDPFTASSFGGATLGALGSATLNAVLPLDPALIGATPLFQSLELGPQQLALTNPVVLSISG